MAIDGNLKSLRTLARKSSKTVIDHIVRTNMSRLNKTKSADICVFCASNNNLTKEHVIPKWTFENSPEKFFNTDVNGLGQSYIKTTVPACSTCNNDLLSSLELYITKLFLDVDPDERNFTNDELSYIISWLEIIDFKFEILNARRVFKVSKEKGFIPYLADFPISVLRHNINFSPAKAVTEIRRSQKRLTIKNKSKNFNSLVIFKTSNKSFHFFHKMDNFIFIELPQHEIALFYFYKQQFKTVTAGHKAAMTIIEQVYN